MNVNDTSNRARSVLVPCSLLVISIVLPVKVNL
jgi:hypothetical protein